MMLHQRKNLIIIEDDPLFRKSLEVEFEERGYDVFSFESMTSANLALGKGIKFDFALLDMRLGNELGLPLIPALLRENPANRVVVLSGYPTVATVVGSIKAGAVNFLLKPSSIEILEQALWLEGIDNHYVFEKSDEIPTTIVQYERELIEFVLSQCGWNITKAAKRLGIQRQSLQRKIKKLPQIAIKQK